MTLSRYLTSQNFVRPMMIAASAGTIFTVLTQPAVYRLGLGLRRVSTHAMCCYDANQVPLYLETATISRLAALQLYNVFR